MNSADFSFRPVSANDISMLYEWHQRPHVAEWWDVPESPDELLSDFVTDADAGTQAYIAYLHTQPIGFIQSYVVTGSGEGWWEEETDPEPRGTDQFLADPSQLNRGIGSAMLRAFLHQLFSDPAVTVVQTDPKPTNTRAIRAFAKAGFKPIGVVKTPDGPAMLMRCARSDLGTSAI